MTSIADENLTHVNPNRLSHFQHVQQLQRHFWTRWSREYVTELQQRCKWKSNYSNLRINDLVIIKDDNKPPLRWSLGRIVVLHPGKDDITRVATIKTSSGTLKRSFAKICPLRRDV
uniref:DUF5641 domain-containing protein n=1 Tax=Anoplophora glabripennis TaxID=217634 RepID=V5FXJ1_ANOGL